jgi:3-oxoadipate enol-lactonase
MAYSRTFGRSRVKATINGINLAYSDQGQGQPIVFLHAFPLNRSMWEPQVQALSKRFRVVTVDLRGHGESDAPLWRYTLDQFAEDLYGLLGHLAIRQPVLAGLSMGGYVLFAYYRKYGRSSGKGAGPIKGMILADTRAGTDTMEGRAGRYAMAQTAYTQGAGAIADLMLPKLLSPASLQSRPDLVARVRDMIAWTQLSGVVGDLMAMAERPDSVPLLKQIACPTLVIVGQDDQATPPAEAQLIAEHIKGARLEIVPGAGHLPNLEQPEAFNRAVMSFMDSLGSAKVRGKE